MPVSCCLFCGRDTMARSQICRVCTGEREVPKEPKAAYWHDGEREDEVDREVTDAMRDATE